MTTLRAVSRVLLASLFASLATTARAEDIFVTAKGQTQGDIVGWFNPFQVVLDGQDVRNRGYVEDLAWSVTSPRDAASGLPTGRRVHHPLTLRVRMSSATLALASALSQNENLSEVKVSWFVPTIQTGEVLFTRELVLANANVASFSTYTSKTEDGTRVTYVDVAFTYQRIGIHDPIHGVSYDDDWETQVP